MNPFEQWCVSPQKHNFEEEKSHFITSAVPVIGPGIMRLQNFMLEKRLATNYL